MKPAVSWRIEGIAPLARESAREAARRAGLSLGEWLNAAIIDSASDALAQKPTGKGEESPRKLAEAIARLSERLEELVDARTAREAALADPGQHPTPAEEERSSDIDQAVAEIAARQRSLEGVTEPDAASAHQPGDDQAAAAEEAATAAIDNEMVEAVAAIAAEATAEPVEIVAPVAPETVVAVYPEAAPQAEIALPQAETPLPQAEIPLPQAEIPLQNVSGLERHLLHISEQIEMLQRPNPFEADLADLRRDLAEIKQSLAGTTSRAAADAMEDRIRAHTSRVDWEREDADDMAPAQAIELRPVPSPMPSYEPTSQHAPADELAELEEEVSALSRKIDTVAANGADQATMQHLETAIAELRRLSDSVASGDAVTKLADNVREVAEKIDKLDSTVGSIDAVAALERRLEPFGGSFAEYAAIRNGGAVAPAVEAPTTVASGQLEILESVRAERAALEQLETQIAKIAEKLEASDQRMAQVGAIERTIADLFMHVEDTRIGAIEAAERAAKAAALEISTAEAGERAAVEMLQRELMDLRETQFENDHRTQQTLESVHDAVQHMIDRMASMDLSRPAAAPSPPPQAEAPVAPPAPPIPVAQRPAPEPALASPPARPPARSAPPVTPPAPPSPPAPPVTAVERRPIDATLPADTPLEPGSGAPRVRPGSPAERIAASEAALGAAKPAAPANDKANFIAAARRAAQAAAADAAATESPGEAEAASRASGFSQVLGRHRRSLLMGIAAVVVLAGTVQVVTRYTKTASPPTEAARTPQPADAPATFASGPSLNVASDPILPPASTNSAVGPTVDGKAQNIADSRGGNAAMEFADDITGSTAKPPNSASLTPLAPVAAPPAPPAPAPVASLDPTKLPAGIGPAHLRTAAAGGDAAAAYEIATRFAEGRGVPTNMEEAARWFTRAADQGLAPAQYRLGSLYEKGQGVKKDIEAARRLYVSASDKGNAKAMHNLAVLFAEGIEGKADYKTASLWFRKAAERGLADSQYNLGILCARGIGIERNLAESYKWFSLAAAQGDQDAGRKREDIAQRLDPQSLAAAKVAVQTFTPEPQPDEAVNVKTPPGGWDRAATTTVPPKPKTAPNRKVGST